MILHVGNITDNDNVIEMGGRAEGETNETARRGNEGPVSKGAGNL